MTPPEIVQKCLARTTWRELAWMSGVSIQSLANWRDGKTEPTLFNLSAVCLAAGYQLTINGEPIDTFAFDCVADSVTSSGRACKRILRGDGRLSDLQLVMKKARLGVRKL